MKQNMHRVGLHIMTSAGEVHIKARLACILADEKALKECYSVKGAAGTKPCLKCSNVVRRKGEVAAPLVCVRSADLSAVRPHTVETFTAACNRIEATATAAPREERAESPPLATLQQYLGIVYCEGGMTFDRETRGIAQAPRTAYFDWMHCIVASGGIAQYEVNQLSMTLHREGFTRQRQDEFAQTLTFPRSQPKMMRNFFTKRISKNVKGHCRSFSAETMAAVVALGAYIDLVIRPLASDHDSPWQRLAGHVRCFSLLRRIVELLRDADHCVPRVDELDGALKSHHELFATLYPQCVKPKLHFMRHLPEQLRQHGVLLSCFATERKHKFSKKVAAFCYKDFCRTMLSYAAREVIDAAKDRHSLQPFRLDNPRGIAQGSRGIARQEEIKFQSNGMVTPQGMWKKNDVLLARNGRCGIAQQFWQYGNGVVGVTFLPLEYEIGQRWRSVAGQRSERVVATDIFRALPFRQVRDRIYIFKR